MFLIAAVEVGSESRSAFYALWCLSKVSVLWGKDLSILCQSHTAFLRYLRLISIWTLGSLGTLRLTFRLWLRTLRYSNLQVLLLKCLLLLQAFTARQINKIKRWQELLISCLKLNLEHSMRSTWLLIEFGFSVLSLLLSDLQQLESVVITVDLDRV